MEVKSGQMRRSGRPTESEAERLNADIIRAALKVFVSVGFSGASMEQVIQECGATRRSVMRRFPSKETLLLAALDIKSREVLAHIVEPNAIISAKPIDTLRDACNFMYEGVLTTDSVDLYRLCVAEAARFSEVSALFISINDRLADNLEGLVRRAQRTGAFPGLPSSSVATSLIGTFISNPLNRLVLGDVHFSVPKYRAQYFEKMWSFTTLQSHVKA